MAEVLISCVALLGSLVALEASMRKAYASPNSLITVVLPKVNY